MRGKSCEEEVEVPASCYFAIFHAQTPWKTGEVDPKLLGRLSQPGKEHIEAATRRHFLIQEGQCSKQLPRLLRQYVDFGCFHRRKLFRRRRRSCQSSGKTESSTHARSNFANVE